MLTLNNTMAITTLSDVAEKKPNNILTYIMGILGIGMIVYFGGELVKNFTRMKGMAGLVVSPIHGRQDVYLNGEMVGTTPFESKKIKPGNNKVTLKEGERQYETTINFLSNEGKYFHTIGVFRDLGTSDVFSGGQDIWFEKDDSGSTIKIISDPPNALISVDKTELGKTPYASGSLAEGSYDIKISLDGYETQNPKVNIKKGYTLNINARLFPNPVPEKLKKVSGYETLYDLSSSNAVVISDPQAWAKAIPYWATTRGIELDDGKIARDKVFDFFVDYKGNIYDSTGNAITSTDEMAKLKDSKRAAYLGKTVDGTGLSKEAKEAVSTLLNPSLGSGSGTEPGTVSATGKKVKIASTPTGWLRVRNAANLNGVEIGKVNVGDTFEVLEEKPGWKKIKVSETLVGWVSADYTIVVQ
jgi:hypothetical protein